MEVIAVILPLALLMSALAVYVFVRCARGGQYDDLDTPPQRILTDDADLSGDPRRNRTA